MSSRLIRGDLSARVEPCRWTSVDALPPVDSIVEPSADSTGDGQEADCERRENEAFERGVATGESAAEEQFTARLLGIEERMARAIEAMASLEEQIVRDCRADLVALAFGIARRVLHRELTLDPDAVRGIVSASIEKLGSRTPNRVRVHPSQGAPLRAILAERPGAANVEVAESAGLEPGDMIFETDTGHLNASIDAQLEEIRNGLADELG